MKIHFLPTVWSDMEILEHCGKFALIDTAHGAYHYQMINDYFEKHGIKDIEFILITHFHPDHYGALKMIVEKYNVKTVYLKEFSGLASTDGDGNPSTPEYLDGETANCQEIKKFCGEHSSVVMTDSLTNIDFLGINIEIFYGENTIRRVFEDKNYESFGKYICNENQNSLMAYFTYGGRSVLMAADITDMQFPHPDISMMNTRAARKIAHSIDIYKVPHHGCGIGSDEALSIYKPEYNIITNMGYYIAGKTDDEERLLKFNPNAKIFYTGDGTVVFDIAPDGTITASRE